MRKTIIVWILRWVARLSRYSFYDSVNLTRAFDDVAASGVVVEGSGFVFDSGGRVMGLYVVEYKSDIMENRYGRYN